MGRTLKARSGTSLIDVLHAYGVEFPCGGKGICGKCRVRLLKGDIPLDAIHRKKLQDLHLDEKWRLACMSRVQEDIVLEVGQYVTPVMAGDEEFEFTPVSGFGVAVDVGTTTLVAQLLDLSTGRVLGVETGLNPQRKTGSDLISRLEYAREHGAEELRDVIREQVERMIRNLLVPEHDLPQKVILVGNTVMQHLFCGLDVTPLSYYPFESDHLGIHCFSASELGWDLPLKQICFYPSVGSFVGSDVLAGIHAIGMASSPDYQVLVDLGTNGEIAVGNRDRILVASTAAGPAFEGAKISQGMLATTGAIMIWLKLASTGLSDHSHSTTGSKTPTGGWYSQSPMASFIIARFSLYSFMYSAYLSNCASPTAAVSSFIRKFSVRKLGLSPLKAHSLYRA